MILSDFASILLYLAAFSAAIVFAYLGQKKHNKIFSVIAILIPVIIAGFRYSTGTDSLTYRKFYEQIGTDSPERISARLASGEIEPFVIAVSRFGNILGLPVAFLFVVFALITTSFLYFTAKNASKDHAWLCYGMLIFVVFPESMNIMRQLAAISAQAFALAYMYRAQQKGQRYSVALVLALAGFSAILHFSSILVMPVLLLPFITKHFHTKSLVAELSVLAIVCALALPIVIEIAISSGILSARHLQTFFAMDGSIINIKFAVSLILALVLLASYHRRKEQSDKQYGLLMLLGTSYAATGFYSAYLGRLALFFWIFDIVIISDIICQLFEKDKHRVAVGMTIAVLYFIVYFGIAGMNELMPYSFAF